MRFPRHLVGIFFALSGRKMGFGQVVREPFHHGGYRLLYYPMSPLFGRKPNSQWEEFHVLQNDTGGNRRFWQVLV